MERFQYGLLDKNEREIRVFRLRPAACRDEPVSGDLITVSLNKQPKYEALSYVWGIPTPAVDILVGGLPFSIGPNLHGALLDMRQERTPLLLWIDAICINQGDVFEREHQVSMMREIYSQARLVHAWLDEHIDSTAKPFREILRLRKRGPANFDALSFRSVIGLFWAAIPFLFYSATGIRRELTNDPAFWDPVIRVFDNEYWNRLWIQQEILLARKVVFHCREHVIPEKGLFRFQDALKSHNDGVENGDSGFGDIFEMNMPGYFNTLNEGRQHVAYSRASDSGAAREPDLFFKLFLDSCNLRVTDPRDRVYGCLGLLGTKQRAQITVDYSFDLNQTYAQVFRSHIYETGNLEFLCSTIDSAEAMPHTLPVWMPAPEKGSIFFYQEIQRHKRSPPPSQPVGVISTDGTVLSIKGFQVDTIRRAGKNEPIFYRPILEWVEEVQAMNRELNPHDALDALWDKPYFAELFRFGCNDNTYWHIWHRRPPTSSDLKDVLKEIIVRSPGEAGKHDLDLLVLREGVTDQHPDSDIIISMCEAVKSSSFFMSTTHQLGLISASNAHLHAETGDLIFIVLGCPKPLVLRPTDGGSQQFLLIGSVVLPHMMDGSFAESFLRQKGTHEGNQDMRMMNIDLI
ncbi:heterokaryon incompatibility protein-domain-containing protein [Hypomontagnella submonticulosa]|nr:heterokaryon incompatibility protein-domain-containing protein [Hypomontagnella submonticulosa]